MNPPNLSIPIKKKRLLTNAILVNNFSVRAKLLRLKITAFMCCAIVIQLYISENSLTGNEELFCLEDASGKLWVEVIIVTFLEAVESIDVLTACINDVKLGQNLTRLHNLHDFMLIVLFF